LRRDMDAMTRGERTVVVEQLQVKATERDIKHFFKQVCKVKDVSLLRDKISHRSKGIAYVELETLGDRDAALQLNGTSFVFRDGKKGFPCVVKQSEAEKNFTHLTSAVITHSTKRGSQGAAEHSEPSSACIQLLHLPSSADGTLLEGLCSEFGTIHTFEIWPDDQNSSRCKASVRFTRPEHAAAALAGLDNRKVEGQALVAKRLSSGHRFSAKATQTSAGQSNPSAGGDAEHKSAAPDDDEKSAWRLDHDDRGITGNSGGVSLNAAQRISLMSKLAGGAARDMIKPLIQEPRATESASASATTGAENGAHSAPKPGLGPLEGVPSACLLVRNMFDPASETEPGWVEEIKEEVQEVCEQFGTLETVVVDERNPEGKVFVRFATKEAAERAAHNLHGRFFDKRTLSVRFLSEADFLRQCPRR